MTAPRFRAVRYLVLAWLLGQLVPLSALIAFEAPRLANQFATTYHHEEGHISLHLGDDAPKDDSSALDVVLFLALVGGFFAYTQPIRRTFARLRKSEEPAPADLEKARARLERVPLIGAALATAASLWSRDWAVLGLGGSGVEHLSGAGKLLVGVLAAATSGAVAYLWLDARNRGRYVLHLFAGEPLYRVRVEHSPGLRLQFGLLLGTTVWLPLMTLAALPLLWGLGMEPADAEKILPLMIVAPLVGLVTLPISIAVAFALVDAVCGPIDSTLQGLARVQRGEFTERLAVLGGGEIGRLRAGFNRMLEGLQEREVIKDLFGRYMSPSITEEILRRQLRLGGERYHATVLFSDIRGFTNLSSELEPEEVIRFLNEYFSFMVDAIQRNHGIVDKFIGDGILAVFGLPVRDERHAEHAFRAAVEMRTALATLNEQRTARGEAPLAIGVGVHSGDLVAGNIGSKQKLEYTVIGDTVNVSSRIESETKRYKVSLLVSETTHEALPPELRAQFVFTPQEPVVLRGKSRPITLYAVEPV